MTRGQILNDIKAMIAPGGEATDAELIIWINDYYQYMVDEIQKVTPEYFAKPATADLVGGQQEYELPDDFSKILLVNQNVGGTWRRVLPLSNINALNVPTTTTSISADAPRYYIVGDYIGLSPIPQESVDEGLKMWYVYDPAELSTDSAEPAFKSKYHPIIKYGVYANYLDQDDEHASAVLMRRQFEDRVEKMLESISEQTIDEPRSIQIATNRDAYSDEWDI